MSKKTFMAAIIILAFLVSLVAGMQAVEVAKANPMIYPNEPNTDLPTMQIQQPQNHSTTYANNTLNLNLTVTIPTSWDSYKQPYGFPQIGAYGVIVYLEGTQYPLYENTGVQGIFVYNHTVTFNNLTTQMHTAKIELTASTFSNSYEDYHSNITQVILFQINPKTQTILYYEYPVTITRDPYPPPKKASVPDFSLKYIDNSYHANGYYAQNKSIEVIIKNQPTFNVLCYNVKSKSHLSENWTSYEYYNNSSYVTPHLFVPNRLLAWNSTMTVLVFGFEGNNGSDNYNLMLGKVNDGDQIDFQVQAYIGNNWFPGKHVNATASIEYYLLNIDAIGDWSPIQTVTIPANNTPSPTVPEFPSWIILFLILALIAATIYSRRKR